jgi:hypothetical protein
MAAVMEELAMVLVVTQLSKNATPLATSSLGATSLYITKQKVDAGSIQKNAPNLLPLDAKLTDQTTVRDLWLKINSLNLPLILKIHSRTLSSSWLSRTPLSMTWMLPAPMKKLIWKKKLPALHQNLNSCGMAAVMVELAMVLVVTQLSKNATPLATSSLGATSLYTTKHKVDAGSIQQHAPSQLPLDAKLTNQLVIFWIWLMIFWTY